MSAGFGGRLFGFMASNCQEYIVNNLLQRKENYFFNTFIPFLRARPSV